MLIQIYRYLQIELRNNYFSKWFILTTIINILVNLLIYWFTAKAFSPKFSIAGQESGVDYFTFVVVGEAILAVPLVFLAMSGMHIRSCINHGVADVLMTNKTPFEFSLLQMSLASSWHIIIQTILTLIFAHFAFGLDVNHQFWGYIIGLELVSFPLFLGLGFLGSSMIFIFRKGSGSLNLISSFFAVVSGVYFPISVFSVQSQEILNLLSPLNILLLEARKILIRGWHPGESLNAFLIMGTWSIIIFPLSFVILRKSINYYRKKAMPLIFTN